jgi:hypothetical protein
MTVEKLRLFRTFIVAPVTPSTPGTYLPALHTVFSPSVMTADGPTSAVSAPKRVHVLGEFPSFGTS